MTPTSTPTSTPAPTAAPRSRRTWWQAVLVLVVLGVAVHVLLPQVDQARRTLTSLGDATWWFVPLAAVFAAMTFPGAAWSLEGSTSRPLRFGSTVEACVASACLGRIAPANLGSLGVSGAYLHATGASVGETTAALGLDAVAGALVHVLLLAATAALVGQFPHAKLALPENFGLIVVIVAVLLVMGVAAGVWWSRRRHTPWGALVHRFVTALREGRVELAGALRSPRRAALLLGGSLVVTLAQIACLATSLAAFDADVDLITIGFVYLAGAAVSAVAPTPGGLGAMEAALVSGLTLFGVAAGPAVTGVLLYRLLTFWGPILPGAVAVRRLRRRHLL